MLFRAIAPKQLDADPDDAERSQLFVASDETVDHYGDVIDAEGWQLDTFKANPVALWSHNQREPAIGHVDPIYVDSKTRRLMARINFDPPGDPRVDRLWDQVKRRTLRAVSVGFNVLSPDDIEPIVDKSGEWSGGLRFLRAQLLELSLCNVPANPNALAVLRAFDPVEPLRTVSLPAVVSRSSRPTRARVAPSEGNSMTVQAVVPTSERIVQLEQQRAARQRALVDLTAVSEREGRANMTDEEQTAFDEISTELTRDEQTLTRLRSLEATIAASAQRPQVTPRIEIARAPTGVRYARMLQAFIAARCNFGQAYEISKRQWPDDADINNVLRAAAQGYTRAAVATATTTDPAWAGALVSQQTLSAELITLVEKQAIIGQLTQVQRVPFNVRIPREVLAMGGVGWVGQGLSKPVGKGGYDFVTMPFSKVALIAVMTQELARFSDPSAETMIRDSLVRAISDYLNSQFVSSTAAPVANLSPGGINNGLPVDQIVASTGATEAAIRLDLMTALSRLYTASGGAVRFPTWIMHPLNALWMGGVNNAQGAPAFPGVSTNGGTLLGYPLITSNSASPTEITLIDQGSVLLASDPVISVDSSTEASVQLDSAPASPPTPLVSFWQQNLIGIKAEQFAHWMRARDGAVVLITGVGYVPAGATRASPDGSPPNAGRKAA